MANITLLAAGKIAHRSILRAGGADEMMCHRAGLERNPFETKSRISRSQASGVPARGLRTSRHLLRG